MTNTKINAASSVDVTPAMRNYLDNSINKIADQLPKDAVVCWTIKYVGKDRHLKLSIVSRQYVVRCEARNKDFYDSADMLVDRASTMSRKYMESKRDRKRRKTQPAVSKLKKKTETYIPAYIEKSISPIAMSLESAEREFQKSGCKCFVYLDKETLNPCVLSQNDEGLLEVIHILDALGGE